MQIVYLSNRPDVLAGTLDAVRRYMPWIDHALVCAPKDSHDTIRAAVSAAETAKEPAWTNPLELVADDEVTGSSTTELAAMDHVTRNVSLRRALIERSRTADIFILSDDDYRPLTDIPITDYVDEDGRHHGYFFYDLADWPGAETPYDEAQVRTLAVLRLLDRPTLAYGAHMPQIMTREHWIAAFDLADGAGAGNLIDEWSLYFNAAIVADPAAFADPAPFRTLAWPQWPHQWPHWVRPHPIRFENHYPEHEAEGGLFAGLGPVVSDADAIERIVRWRQAELAIGELRFDKDWNDPWTRGQPHRRGAAAALRAAGKVRKYSGLGRGTGSAPS